MKCHYEILGIRRDADDSEIKTAYRKLALRWHPDKNLDSPEEAKEQFQLVQQAYEILSDSHERSWYDNHREQILRGRNSDYEDSCLDVFQYFTVSCFKGYNDDEKGFYKVYSNVFETIAAEDADFINEDEYNKMPKFGNSQSNYEEVVGPFYAYWQSYSTKKSYAWLCPYNVSEIKDRRVLREIEKEMKKIVQKARRERNEEVRNLVSFIRKRDKRVQAYKKYLEEKAALNRQKQEQNRLEQIRKRQQEIENLEKPGDSVSQREYEEQLKLLVQEYSSDNSSSCDEEDDDNTDEDENKLVESTDKIKLEETSDLIDLYCVACNKYFKNVNAFQNHESSKKHRDNFEKMKTQIITEGTSFSTNEQQEFTQIETSLDDDSSKQFELEEIQQIESKPKNRKNKKLKRTQNINEIINDGSFDLGATQISDKEDDNWNDNKKFNKKSKSKKMNQKISSNKADAANRTTVTETQSPSSIEDIPSPKSKNTKEMPTNIDLNHICVSCKSVFESKNKLFQHLKSTNHGVYIPKHQLKSSNTESHSNKKGRNKRN